jgi:hypothetical protein
MYQNKNINSVTCYYGGRFSGRDIMPGDHHGKRYTFLRVKNVKDSDEINKKKVTIPEDYYQLLIRHYPQQFIVTENNVSREIIQPEVKITEFELKRKPGRPAKG